MKMKYAFAVIVLLLLTACSNEKETPSGMKFTVVKAGDGVLPKPGDVVMLDYVFLDSKDSVWQSSKKDGQPVIMNIADTSNIQFENGLVQMLRMVSKGDSININVPITDYFGKIIRRPMPPEVDSTLNVIYQIKINNIMDGNAFQDSMRIESEKKEREQLALDTATIAKYLAEKSIKATKTENGVYYVVTKPGKGANATAGQKVKVVYSGYLLDGTYFDSNDARVVKEKNLQSRGTLEPYEVTIDSSPVIRGWHEVLKQMNKGSKVTAYIPSTMAYGPRRRSEIIKENSILVFDMEAVSVE
jgi:FKBP-type peptidyl-prolyl cis-trans isomerase